jgi:hypothetical protein
VKVAGELLPALILVVFLGVEVPRDDCCGGETEVHFITPGIVSW